MMWWSSPPTRHSLAAFLILLVVVLGLGREPAWAAHGDRTYRVVDVEYDDVLNIRAGPSMGHPVVGEIPPAGRGVQLLGACRVWCPVSYNGASGWVYARYLAIEPAVAPFVGRLPPTDQPAVPMLRKVPQLPAYWRVTGVAVDDGLKVHGEPSPGSPVVHVFEARAACIRLAGGCQKPWCQVKFPTGGGDRVGWVDSKNLVPADGACGR